MKAGTQEIAWRREIQNGDERSSSWRNSVDKETTDQGGRAVCLSSWEVKSVLCLVKPVRNIEREASRVITGD